jgi:hypothetical protein
MKKIFQFYLEGFRRMRVGRALWGIIGIKFLLFFVVMKVLFFPNLLQKNFSNDTDRANHVLENLTKEDR